jgi:hypothetical protein
MKDLTEKEIIELNIMFADFMKYPKNGVFYDIDVINPITFNGRVHHQEQLCFHLSWEWLMPVVEMIESLNWHPKWSVSYRVIIYPSYCQIDIGQETIGNEGTFIEIGKTKREAVWFCCVEFIKWYNKFIKYYNNSYDSSLL